MRLPTIGQGEQRRVDDERAIPLLHHAFQAGINFVDSAVFYCNSDSQRAVGEALKGWRDRIVVSTKNDYQDVDERRWWKNLEDSLRFLQTDYIDIYNVHGISLKSWTNVVEPHISRWLTKARDQGLIRHVGCSSHDSDEGIRAVLSTGFFQSVILQYNMLNRRHEGALAFANERGIGTIVMGPLSGGKLALPNEVFDSALPGRSSGELALRFVLANSNVSLAMSGMESPEIIDRNAAVAGDPVSLTAEDYGAVDKHLRRLQALAELCCTGCGYCMPCPQNVQIPRIFDLYNLARVYGLRDNARRGYAAILKDASNTIARQADACTQCGLCEAKCPQKIAIRKQLAEAHAALAIDD